MSEIVAKMDEQSEWASDLESTTTSETLTSSDEGPVIFCSMGRIATIQSESSAEEQPKHRSPKSSGHPKRETLRNKYGKNRENSSSHGRKSNVNSFKRESSEIPDGGWFRATTAVLSSDSSSESSLSEDEKRAKQRHRSSVKRVIKIKKPFTYDGRADLDVLDQWTYEVDTWRDWNRISDKMVVKILVNFMSGKASQFFMKHIALRQNDWTVKSVYEGLFNYCFPPDFKLQLRDQLTSARQGKSDIRDFQRDLETLAARFPDVTERQLAQIFWNGLNQCLRMHLIEKGLSPEKHAVRK
jgi:hypothetical protein